MSEGRIPKVGTVLAFAFFFFLFGWMLTRPFEHFFGNPEDGGPLEVHFGTPLSRVIYTYWPESGAERLRTSTGMGDRLKIEIFHLISRREIDFGEYEIRGQEITGSKLRREYAGRNNVVEITETGVPLNELPGREMAKEALYEARRKIRTRWPQVLTKAKPVLTTGH